MTMPPAPDALGDSPGNRVSRFRRKRDLGKPLRPVTAYDVFFRSTYPWLKAGRSDLNQQEMFSEIGRMWRETATWEDRQVCYDCADWERDNYDKEMIKWRMKREEQKRKYREEAAKKKQANVEQGAEETFQGEGQGAGAPRVPGQPRGRVM